MTDNPYVEAQLAMDGQVHCGEIHAAAVTDQVMPRPTIGPDKLWLLDREYQDWMIVDDVLVTIQDQSLTAEVIQWQALQKQFKTIQESICKMEDQLFAVAVDQRASHNRLEEAWAAQRIEEEMQRDRQVTALTAWLVEHGCSS
jgi:hypothetical protein